MKPAPSYRPPGHVGNSRQHGTGCATMLMLDREDVAMSAVNLVLDEDLVQLLSQIDQPVERTVRELIVLELYRRELITSGRAAELLGMHREAFIAYAGEMGIPYFRMTPE